MKAKTGDRITLAGAQVDRPTRDGEIVEVRGKDGGPPYLVRRDDGHTGLLYPGAGSVLRVTESGADDAPASPGGGAQGVVRQWHLEVSIFETGDDTTATVALSADSPETLTGRGTTHRGGADGPDPHIGDHIAVARALHHLADDLLARVSHDIETATGESDVHVRSR